jgi:CheY-like chemotaxis protein
MAHRVLVVDDDADIRDTVIEVLQDSGHDVMGASNGVEALQQLRTASVLPCVILLDLMMPHMDGEQFRAEQLKDPQLSRIPVVIISAFRDTAERAKALNAAGHLTKPVSIDALMLAINSVC